MKTIKDIKNITIVGGGNMGMRIALNCAMNNYNVIVYDILPDFETSAKTLLNSFTKFLIEGKKIAEENKEEILKRISYTTDINEATKNPDLISESVIEDIDIKKKVWLQLGALCPKDTIFTTNTSSLLPSTFAEETGRANLFCGLHFHDVFRAVIVDIMPNPKTEKQVVELLVDFAKSIQQIPIVLKKENSGYIYNAMFIPWLASACNLRANDVASIQDIDRAWMVNSRTKMGPLATCDFVGLDTMYHVSKGIQNEVSQQNAKYIKENFLDKGKLGIKSGEGFYTYPNPKYLEKDFIKG